MARSVMVYVELWYDAEGDNKWKLTVWYIQDKDFDPFAAEYETLDFSADNIQIAKKKQEEVATTFRQSGCKVIMNNYNPDSFFWLRPKWFEELLATDVSQKKKSTYSTYEESICEKPISKENTVNV